MDSGDALGLQGADIIHVHAPAGGGHGGGHGVLLAMLAAHAGQGDLGPGSEGAGLQPLSHPGAEQSGVSEEEVKGMIAKAMKDFAATLMADAQ